MISFLRLINLDTFDFVNFDQDNGTRRPMAPIYFKLTLINFWIKVNSLQ